MWHVVFVDTKKKIYKVHHPVNGGKDVPLKDDDDILYNNVHLRDKLSDCLDSLADITGMSVKFNDKLKSEDIPPRENGHPLSVSECGFSNSDLSKVFKRAFKYTIDRYLDMNAGRKVNTMRITSNDMWLSDLLRALFGENRIKSTIIEQDYLDVQRYDKLGKEPENKSQHTQGQGA